METDPYLQRVHPVLAAWFKESFNEPTDVQVQAWASIEANRHTLIAAPTGSGKTLAAMLPGLNRIIQSKLNPEGEERPGVKLLYITPLKALNNDIHHHVVSFAAELDKLAERTELSWLGLKAAVRTGDTPQKVRASILRKPPDILVTTPETLYLMLTSLKAREILRSVEQVIVDEIHYIAGDKRGLTYRFRWNGWRRCAGSRFFVLVCPLRKSHWNGWLLSLAVGQKIRSDLSVLLKAASIKNLSFVWRYLIMTLLKIKR